MTTEFKSDKIIDYEGVVIDYAGSADLMLQNFETTCFDVRVAQLYQGMMERDWVKAMQSAHTLKGSSGYIKAGPFERACRTFQEFIKQHCERIEYPDISTEDRPQYKLLEHLFTDEKKLTAYEYYYPLVEQAILLKYEMSKYTKSVVPDRIFQKEIQDIRKIHEEFKQSLMQSQQPAVHMQKGNQNSVGFQSMKSLTSKPNNMVSSVVDAVTVDPPPPQNSQCCDKCMIF